MTVQSSTVLKGYFETGDKPTQSQFGDLVDTVFSRGVNVMMYGAKGDGATDDTTAIQAALTASKSVYFPPGRYIVSATLTPQPGAVMYGDAPEITILQRTANYGNTITIGDANPGTGALDFRISGIYFYKPFAYTAGTTSTIQYPVTANAAHVAVTVATGGIIENCWFSSMPFGVTFQQSSLCMVRKCQFSGIWDPSTAGLQEAQASILFKSTGSYNVLMSLIDNSIAGGYASAVRSVTVGSATLSISESIGPIIGVLCEGCEGLVVRGNYIGGNSRYGMEFDRKEIIAGVKISDNFFDPAISTCIYTRSTTGDAIGGLDIIGNNFNGQLVGLRAVLLDNNGSVVSTNNVNISNNVFENFATNPLYIAGAKGAIISDNNIAAYSTANGGTTPDFAAGIYILGSSSKVKTSGNMYGGRTNDLGAVNNCKWGAYFASAANGFAENEHAVSLGQAGGALVFPAQVGDVVESTVLAAAAVSLTTTTTANVTSITLTPGTWNLWGNVAYVTDPATVVTNCFASLGATSAAIGTTPDGGAQNSWRGSLTGSSPIVFAGFRRATVTVDTVYYLLTFSTFTTSTQKAYGYLGAQLVQNP